MLLCLLWTGSTDVYGQKARQRRMGVRVDTLALKHQTITDSLATDSITTDSLAILNQKDHTQSANINKTARLFS